jgi:IclR family acetate operon transcriptional repressor
MIVAAAEAVEPLKISAPPGTAIPLLAGAVGKAFLAREDPLQLRKLIRDKGLPRFTSRSIVDLETYLAQLAAVRRRGYATDFGEYLRGVHAVALSIDNRKGLPMALWVVGLAASLTAAKIDAIGSTARATAEALKSLLDN